MLFGVDANYNIRSVFIDGPKDIMLTREDLRAGTNYFLLPMPSGSYSINKVKLNKYQRFDMTDGMWSFDVEPGVISYVGHLNIRHSFWSASSSHFELQNRSSQALTFMEQDFPTILQSRQLRYSGPGEDPFFDYATTVKNMETSQ